MVSASIPIFRGKYRAMIKRAELNTESLELMKANTENQLTAQLASIQSKIESQSKLGELYEAQIKESDQILNLLQSQYRNSSSAIDEILDVQRQLLKYQKLKQVAQAEFNLAIEELEYITSKHNNDEVEY